MGTAIERLIELDERASEKHRDREAYLGLMDAVIEALPDALVVTDATGKVVLFNERAEFMFGYPRSEMIGKTVERLLPERSRVRHTRDREIYNRFEISQRARTMGVGMNLLGIRSDGHEFPVEITLARMIVPKGIFNLALVRFAARLLARDPAAAGPEPESERKKPHAGR